MCTTSVLISYPKQVFQPLNRGFVFTVYDIEENIQGLRSLKNIPLDLKRVLCVLLQLTTAGALPAPPLSTSPICCVRRQKDTWHVLQLLRCFGIKIPVVDKKPVKFSSFVPYHGLGVMCILSKMLKYFFGGESDLEEIVFEVKYSLFR